MNCNSCPGKDFEHHEGLFGSNASEKGILFILHRPDSRVDQISLFGDDYRNALGATKTGQVLHDLLKASELSFEDIYLTNLMKCIFQEETVPQEYYRNCLQVLEGQVDEFAPRKIVAFGAPVYQQMFPEDAKERNLQSLVGETLEYRERPTLLSFHPSKIWALRNPDTIRKHYQKAADFLNQ